MDALNDAVMTDAFRNEEPAADTPTGIYLKLLEANPVLYGQPAPKEPRCFSELLSASELGLFEALRTIGDGDRVARLFKEISVGLKRARAIHRTPMAENVFHALSYFEAEAGEAAQEIVKQHDGWQQRADAELVDTIIVAMRMLLREYRTPKEGCNGRA